MFGPVLELMTHYQPLLRSEDPAVCNGAAEAILAVIQKREGAQQRGSGALSGLNAQHELRLLLKVGITNGTITSPRVVTWLEENETAVDRLVKSFRQQAPRIKVAGAAPQAKIVDTAPQAPVKKPDGFHL